MAPEIRFVVDGWHVVLSTHALFVVLAVLAGVAAAAGRAREPAVLLVWSPAFAVAAVGGADLLYRALHGGSGGGLASMGGIAAVALVCALACAVASRGGLRRGADLADAIAVGGLVGLGVGRVGCFLAGCCYGRATDLPWGVVFPDLGPAERHPVQLYAAAFDLTLAGALLVARARPGATAIRAAVGLGAGRLLLETLRDPSSAEPLIAGAGPGALGAGALCAGGLLAWWMGRSARPPGVV